MLAQLAFGSDGTHKPSSSRPTTVSLIADLGRTDRRFPQVLAIQLLPSHMAAMLP
jgi:hypothetical protein